MSDCPDIQLIANIVMHNSRDQVLLTRQQDAACARALAELGVDGAVSM